MSDAFALIDDWRAVLKRAWSLKLVWLAAGLELLAQVVPALSDYLPGWITLAILALATLARLMKQPEKAK